MWFPGTDCFSCMARILLFCGMQTGGCPAPDKTFYIPAGIVGGLTAIYLQSTLEWVMKQQVNFIQMMILFAMLGLLYKYRNAFASGSVEVNA